ncbi:MAG TPA: hypothetical protein VM324_09790 [Egibacteraceae bacterium]|nr:hypothetical protein [Egibacteraceae bacterium]
MLPIERPDYRRSREADLLGGLRSRDPLALAEAYHRTSPAAHACARRLLGAARAVEALLTAVYAELWASPPESARLEGWVRSRAFAVGVEHLRDRREPPAAPSLSLLLPDLPPPEQPAHDSAEQILAALPDPVRRAVLLAHDQGVPTAAHDDPDAADALARGLMSLAGPGEGLDDGAEEQCADITLLGDWTLGLLEAERAALVAAEVADRPACGARSRALRRGRRRLEGLPPAPDMGQRVLAAVVGGTAAPVRASRAPATEAPLAAAVPTSSLGDAVGSPPIPVAPLPSALDDETARPEPAADEADARRPADDPGGQVEREPPAAGPAGEDAVGGDAVDALAGDDGADGDDVEDLALRAAEEDGPPQDEHLAAGTETATLSPAAPRSGRRVGRQMLSVALIVVVIALGGALGLLIGFLLVGGR